MSQVKQRRAQLVPVNHEQDIMRSLNAVIETLTPMVGQAPRDLPSSAVTFRDLEQGGFLVSYTQGTGVSGGSGTIVPDKPDLTVPPAIEGLEISSTFNTVIVSWDQPNYSNHAYVEIWRAPAFKGDDNDIPTVFADAKQQGICTSIVYSQPVQPEDEFRYWFRNVSTANINGPLTSGNLVQVPASPRYLLDKISGEILKDDLTASLGQEITDSTTRVNELTQTTNEQGQQITDLNTTVGNNTAAISQNTTLITDVDGKVEAQWTLRIQNDGIVSGIGLGTSSDGTSAFYVRASRFAVLPPSVVGVPDTPDLDSIPFIVTTGSEGTRVLLRNAYIDQAYIESIATSDLVADSINTREMTAVNITGGTMQIGANFSVDALGNQIGRNVNLSGHLVATSGTMDNVTINENCDVYGTLYAQNIVGDIYEAISIEMTGEWQHTGSVSGVDYHFMDIVIPAEPNFTRKAHVPMLLTGSMPYVMRIHVNGVYQTAQKFSAFGAFPDGSATNMLSAAVLNIPPSSSDTTISLYTRGTSGATNYSIIVKDQDFMVSYWKAHS